MAEAARAGASVFFQDEASVRDFRAGTTTWSAVGQGAVVKTTVDQYNLKLISSQKSCIFSFRRCWVTLPLILQGNAERQSRLSSISY